METIFSFFPQLPGITSKSQTLKLIPCFMQRTEVNLQDKLINIFKSSAKWQIVSTGGMDLFSSLFLRFGSALQTFIKWKWQAPSTAKIQKKKLKYRIKGLERTSNAIYPTPCRICNPYTILEKCLWTLCLEIFNEKKILCLSQIVCLISYHS